MQPFGASAPNCCMMRSLSKVVLGTFALTLLTVLSAAASDSVAPQDRPYYKHGVRCFRGQNEWVWVPGHWSKGHLWWIHGDYEHRDHPEKHESNQHGYFR